MMNDPDENNNKKKRRVSPLVDDCANNNNKKEKEQRKKQQPKGTPTTTRKKERCPASEAIVRIERLGEEKFNVVVAEGWEKVLPSHQEDDPGCLIMWDDDNVDATVAAFNVAIAAGADPPAWLNVGGRPKTITSTNLKMALLTYAQTHGGGGGVVGNALIAPNTMIQYSCVTRILLLVGNGPFFMQHAVCPIGHNYILMERRPNNGTAVRDPIPADPAGTGMQVFA